MSNSVILCPRALRSSITFVLLPSGPTSTIVVSGTIWLCTRGCSIAAETSMPHSRLSTTEASEGKICEPPDPPRTAYSDPSAFRMSDAAVDDSGLA